MTTLVEVCVDSVDGAVAAAGAGADRIELCAQLELDGLTPAPGTIDAARESLGTGLVVLIRPRPGNFVYDAVELEAMRRDVVRAREAGADGVAIGALHSSGEVHVEAMRELVDAARPLAVTCHRSFDRVSEPFEALEALIELGFERVLTSGQAPDVVTGLARLRELIEAAGERITILPGGGVREDNIARVVTETGAREVHFSARAPGSTVTDPDTVRRFIRALG